MSINLQENSTLNKQPAGATTEPTIAQALEVLESDIGKLRKLGYPARVINDNYQGIPTLIVILPRLITVKDERGIHRFVVAQDTTGEAAHE